MAGVCGQIGLVRGTALADAGAVLNRGLGPKPEAPTGRQPRETDMKDADKNRDPQRAQKRALADARCAWRKMDDEQRTTFLAWILEEAALPAPSLDVI